MLLFFQTEMFSNVLLLMVYFASKTSISWHHTFFSCNSLHTMYKLFLSAVEYLPFSSGDASKACFEEIIERFGDCGDTYNNGIHQISHI